LLVLVTLFGGLHSLTYIMYFVFSSRIYSTSISKTNSQFRGNQHPHVSIFIPVYNEPISLVSRIIDAAICIDYPSYEIFILDDSDDHIIAKQNQQIAFSHKIKYIHRTSRQGFKAGAINNGLNLLDHNTVYLLILDVDHVPKTQILKSVIQIAERDTSLAFIQMPQYFLSTKTTPIERAYAFQQHIFHKHVCRGLSVQNSCFMCGTNLLIRKEILEKLGGFKENSITEDLATSFLIHENGYSSVYVDNVLSEGISPRSLSAYFIQQRRWAQGTINQFKNTVKSLFSRPGSLSLPQWWNYLFVNGTFYFFGFGMLFLTIYPIFIYLTNCEPFLFDIINLSLIFYIIMSVLILATGYLERKFNFLDFIFAQSLFFSVFPVFITATIRGMVNAGTGFRVTPKIIENNSERNIFSGYFILMIILIFSFYVGWTRNGEDMFHGSLSYISFWSLYQIFLISIVFIFFKAKLPLKRDGP